MKHVSFLLVTDHEEVIPRGGGGVAPFKPLDRHFFSTRWNGYIAATW